MELKDETHVFVAEGRTLGITELHDIDASLSPTFFRREGEFDATGIWFVQCSHYLKQGCLARAASSDNADYLSPLYVEVNAF